MIQPNGYALMIILFQYPKSKRIKITLKQKNLIVTMFIFLYKMWKTGKFRISYISKIRYQLCPSVTSVACVCTW